MAKILVVDDEPDQRFLTRRVLERAGHEVKDAENGAVGLAVASDWTPDLIITDLMMPVMDGPELIRRLRRDPATARIPIVATSADDIPADGADAVVPKSAGFRDLAQAAAALLQERVR
jgi:CheY-like chemotaxis protein